MHHFSKSDQRRQDEREEVARPQLQHARRREPEVDQREAPGHGQPQPVAADGQPAGEDIDTYADKPGPLGPLELGVFKPVDGAFTLRAKVVGRNAESENTGAYFGLDCVVISKEIGNTAPHGGK